jgi:hypothetical protein
MSISEPAAPVTANHGLSPRITACPNELCALAALPQIEGTKLRDCGRRFTSEHRTEASMRAFRTALFFGLLALLSASPAAAQAAADSAAIRATVLDYVEGWYSGDGDRMKSALHPDLAKRIVRTDPQGRSRLDHMTAEQLVQGTRQGGGKNTPSEKQIKKVVILDIFRNAASARAEMSGWIDYLQLAKWNGRWVIVNVLWELKG